MPALSTDRQNDGQVSDSSLLRSKWSVARSADGSFLVDRQTSTWQPKSVKESSVALAAHLKPANHCPLPEKPVFVNCAPCLSCAIYSSRMTPAPCTSLRQLARP